MSNYYSPIGQLTFTTAVKPPEQKTATPTYSTGYRPATTIYDWTKLTKAVTPAPAPAPAAPAPAPAAPAPAPAAPAPAPAAPQPAVVSPAPATKSRLPLILGLAAAGGLVFFLLRRKK